MAVLLAFDVPITAQAKQPEVERHIDVQVRLA